MVCPFCESIAEYAAGDLVKHILADHPHEAALTTTAIPLVVAAAKQQWLLFLVLFVLGVVVFADWQDRRGFGWST